MKHPSKLMKRALRRPRYRVTFFTMTDPPDATQRIRIRAEDVVIGESVSWHLGADKDGNAVAIYDEDEETVKKFYEGHARTV
jgi:hypothetical protein